LLFTKIQFESSDICQRNFSDAAAVDNVHTRLSTDIDEFKQLQHTTGAGKGQPMATLELGGTINEYKNRNRTTQGYDRL
jgi:hypothetical protein